MVSHVAPRGRSVALRSRGASATPGNLHRERAPTAGARGDRGPSPREILEGVHRLRLEPTTDPFGLDAVLVYVDGEPLYRDTAYGPPLRAAHLHLRGVLAEGDQMWGDPEVFDDGRVPIAACGCGLPQCDSLLARILVSQDEVVWSDLGQYRDFDGPREGRVPEGPLRFDREDYEAEIERVVAHAGDKP